MAEQSDRVGCCKIGRSCVEEPGLAVLHAVGSSCIGSGRGIGGTFSMIYEVLENGLGLGGSVSPATCRGSCSKTSVYLQAVVHRILVKQLIAQK